MPIPKQYINFKWSLDQTTNQYFFIQNLSTWHPANKIHYNQLWLSHFELNSIQIEQLQLFKKVHQEYTYGKNYLGLKYLLPKNIKKQISIKKHHQDIINHTFDSLAKEFDKVWSIEKPKLDAWYQSLNHKSSYFNKIGNNIIYKASRLLGFNLSPQSVNAILLLSAPNWSGGEANLNTPEFITLEISGLSVKNDKRPIFIACHELLHFYYQESNCYQLAEDFINSNSTLNQTKSLQNLYIRKNLTKSIEELIISSLVPSGCLGSNHNSLSPLQAQVANLSLEYLNKNLPIDQNYFSQLKRVLLS